MNVHLSIFISNEITLSKSLLQQFDSASMLYKHSNLMHKDKVKRTFFALSIALSQFV